MKLDLSPLYANKDSIRRLSFEDLAPGQGIEPHTAQGSFIIKQNVQYFPIKICHAVLIARHGSDPAGDCGIMHVNIGGVKLYVMTYA